MVDEKRLMSRGGLDDGATFQVLRCRECNAAVGRVYQTTPRGLDILRDNFTLLEESIASYQVRTRPRTAVVTSIYRASQLRRV